MIPSSVSQYSSYLIPELDTGKYVKLLSGLDKLSFAPAEHHLHAMIFVMIFDDARYPFKELWYHTTQD